MNIPVFFFSGTGNTWWCAEKTSESLGMLGHTASAWSIEKLDSRSTEELVSNADIIGIGYPVYGSDLPQPMKDFILGQLPPFKTIGREVFIFCTQLMFSGDGAMVFAGELEEKGYHTLWSVHFRMPNNICVSVLPIPYKTDRKKIDRRLAKTEKRIESFTAALSSGKKFSQGKSRCSTFLGRLQRNPFRRMWERLRNDVSIDFEKCILCYRCVDICPSGNLIREGDTITTTGSCVLCERCYNFCPVQAVLYMGKPHKEKRGTPYRGPVPEFKPEDLR